LTSINLSNINNIIQPLFNTLLSLEKKLLKVESINILDSNSTQKNSQYNVSLVDINNSEGNLCNAEFYPRFTPLFLPNNKLFTSIDISSSLIKNAYLIGKDNNKQLIPILSILQNNCVPKYFNFRLYLNIYFNPINFSPTKFNLNNIYLSDNKTAFIQDKNNNVYGIYDRNYKNDKNINLQKNLLSIKSYLYQCPYIPIDVVLLKALKGINEFYEIASYRYIIPKMPVHKKDTSEIILDMGNGSLDSGSLTNILSTYIIDDNNNININHIYFSISKDFNRIQLNNGDKICIALVSPLNFVINTIVTDNSVPSQLSISCFSD
jgi:hypothetical protein